MENINAPARGNPGAQVKIENPFDDSAVANQRFSEPPTPVDSSFSISNPAVPAAELTPGAISQNTALTPDGREASLLSSEPFEFKTPHLPQRTNSLKAKTKPSPSSSKSVEAGSDSPKSNSATKKKPAVKIASFAKASPVDRLAPSTVTPMDSKISTDQIAGTTLPSNFSQQNSAGGSKQLTTQTMLPTPALNAALRSYFNYSANSEGSPSTDASRSDDEEDEDEDVEEEEILVYMQFDSKLDSDLLQPHTPFKIIGVDSEKPVLQLGNQVFEGNWNDTVGTAVFFEENPSASPGDPVFMRNPPLTLSYHSKTQKSLMMSRIFVRPKADTQDGDGTSSSTTGPMVPMAIVEVAP